MRCFPSIFMLSDAEDNEAHKLLLTLFLNTAEGIEMKITDGYVDCAVFNSLEEMCTEDNKICLHRCLQHVRGNVKKAANTSPENSDTARLRKPKMLEYFDKFLITLN